MGRRVGAVREPERGRRVPQLVADHAGFDAGDTRVGVDVQDAPVVRGQFTQLKTVQGFKQPLKSSGDFVVAKGGGA